MSLADLQEDEVAFRKSKLITEDVLGKNCLSSMAWILPKTKMGSVVKKTWQTVMEAHVAVNTADGCLLVYSVLVLLKSATTRFRRPLRLSMDRSAKPGG